MTLALLDTDDHAPAVDIGGLQADGLGDAQAGGVAGGQNRPLFGAAHAAEKLEHFLGAQNDGQGLGLVGRRDDLLDGPILLERDLVADVYPYRQAARRG